MGATQQDTRGVPTRRPEREVFKDGYEAGLRDAALRHRNGSGDCAENPTDKQYQGVDGVMPMHLGAYRSETLEERLLHLFTYHAPDPNQLTAYDAIRTGARHFAEVLMKNTPPSADQADALRKLRECVMVANASIALDGRC